MRNYLIALLVAGSSMPLTSCGAEEPDHPRAVPLLSRVDSSALAVSRVLGRQRDLAAALRAGNDISVLTSTGFNIRNDNHGRGARDSTHISELRVSRFLAELNVRSPLNTSALDAAGDLTAYTDLKAYPLSSRQIVVVAQRGDGSATLTSWFLDGERWKATGVVLNPSEDFLATMYELSERFAREQRS